VRRALWRGGERSDDSGVSFESHEEEKNPKTKKGNKKPCTDDAFSTSKRSIDGVTAQPRFPPFPLPLLPPPPPFFSFFLATQREKSLVPFFSFLSLGREEDIAVLLKIERRGREKET